MFAKKTALMTTAACLSRCALTKVAIVQKVCYRLSLIRGIDFLGGEDRTIVRNNFLKCFGRVALFYLTCAHIHFCVQKPVVSRIFRSKTLEKRDE